MMDPDEVDQDSRVPRISRTPREPSKMERENHEISHLPPRDWCAHCRRGRSITGAHSSSGQARDFPIVSIDYMYVGIGKEIEDKMVEDRQRRETNGEAAIEEVVPEGSIPV